jgi:5-methyltetrahydrofolate--homocysteine methyltransferase
MMELGASAVGANCGHAPEEVVEILRVLREAAPKAILIAKPNAGVPRLVKRKAVYDANPERMAGLARNYVDLGASIVGACCGSSPAHIAAMAKAIHGGA